MGQCVHRLAHDAEHVFTYRELYLVGFGGNDYDTQEELDALARACIELRGGAFVPGPDDE